MNIVIDRFRRFETLLHVLLDAATAEMATNLAVIFIEATGNKPEVIPWRSLADRCGQTGTPYRKSTR